jgi:hypothetical protein
MKRGIIAPLMILQALAGPIVTDDDLRISNPPQIPRLVARMPARVREDWI